MKKILSHDYVGTEVNKTTSRKVTHYKSSSFKSANILKTQKSSVGAEERTYLAFGETEVSEHGPGKHV